MSLKCFAFVTTRHTTKLFLNRILYIKLQSIFFPISELYIILDSHYFVLIVSYSKTAAKLYEVILYITRFGGALSTIGFCQKWNRMGCITWQRCA